MTGSATDVQFKETVPIDVREGETLIVKVKARKASPLAAPLPSAPPPVPGVAFELVCEGTPKPRAMALLGDADPVLVYIQNEGDGWAEVAPGKYSVLPILSDFFALPGAMYLATSWNKAKFQEAYRKCSIRRGAVTREVSHLEQSVRVYDEDLFVVRRRVMRFDHKHNAKGIDEIVEATVLTRQGKGLSPPEVLFMLIVRGGLQRAAAVP